MDSFAKAGKTGGPGRRIPFLLPLFLLLALPAIAFTNDIETAGGPEIGSKNPAALYCEEMGYGYEIVAGPEGERGVCVLPDGRRVDAWQFFRGRVAPEYSYCASRGWRVETRFIGDERYDAECAVCVDQSGAEVGRMDELMGLMDRALVGFPIPERTEGARKIAAPAARDLPEAFNWCDIGGCTPVKNQASCGSCWAFGTLGPLECNIKIKDGVTVNLSEQWLVSCNSEGWGCGGGWWAHDYHHWKEDPCGDHGAVFEADFPYTATDAPCACPYDHVYWIDWWDHIGEAWTIPDPALIKQAILDYGPVSVAVDASGMSGYGGGIFSSCSGTSINHAVVLVGWDDNQGAEGVWIMRNSWGTGWGENGGYMRLPYGCASVGYNACWVHYRDPIALSIEGGLPETISAEHATVVTVRIEELTDTYAAGTGVLHYRFDGGDWQEAPLAPAGGELHEATLPATLCQNVTCELYVTAVASTYGDVALPFDAPLHTLKTSIGDLFTIFQDDFETDKGWTVENSAGLTDGAWERGVPVGGGLRGDPPTDSDGSGSCYLTDNVAGNSDVDGGRTWLISPAFDLSATGNYRVCYDVWHHNAFGNDPHNDMFKVHVSNDGGATWVYCDSVGLHTMPGWTGRWFLVNDFVTPTDQTKVRFTSLDLGDGSVVESGIDNVKVQIVECIDTDVAAGAPAPEVFALRANVPNPFNPLTEIRYELPAPASVTLRVYDVQGRVVRTLIDGETIAGGAHSARWDGRDDAGRSVASGVYFSRITAGERTLAGKMVLMK